jgi:hypothetical protein
MITLSLQSCLSVWFSISWKRFCLNTQTLQMIA